jgi:hypothetical protein
MDYIFVNFEAIALGLGTYREQVVWDDPILIGALNGRTDIYHNVVAARTTENNFSQIDWVNGQI